LTTRYPDEYKLLLHLAAGDSKTFDSYSSDDMTWIRHLTGYGLIGSVDGQYHIRIAAVARNIEQQARRLQSPDSDEGRWKLLSEERNRFESRFRKLIRTQLRIAFGPMKAREKIIKAMASEGQKARAQAL